MEAENSERTNGLDQNWLLKTTLPGYTGTSYLQSSKDIDSLLQTDVFTTGPKAEYLVNFTVPATYTVWVRGYAPNAAGDSVYVELSNSLNSHNSQLVELTGFAPGEWGWANKQIANSEFANLRIKQAGVYTVSLWMREDGLRIDRLLLTTNTTWIPADFGPVETERLADDTTFNFMVDRAIEYDYDNLYRLTGADYSTHSTLPAVAGQAGETYAYAYDQVGNRLQQIINGDTTEYLYDAANRLEQLNGQPVYNFDANGNLLNSDTMTNTWDAANRLTNSQNSLNSLTPIYNGVNDRVGQTIGISTTHFALDVQGLPEVIYTSDGESFLHLPGVIMTESSTGEVRYLLSDGLGSVRQAVDETAEVVSYYEFDPYGVPVNNNGGDPYGYTGEWYGGYTDLLHLRARWYSAESGAFLSVDPVESEPPYQYVRGRVVNWTDPSGFQSPEDAAKEQCKNLYWEADRRQCEQNASYVIGFRPLRSYLTLPVIIVDDPPRVIVMENSCSSDKNIWIAVTQKRTSGEFDARVQHSTGVTLGKGVEVGREAVCYLSLLTGDVHCEHSISAEGGALVNIGAEYSIDSAGETAGEVFVQVDVLVADVQVGAGSNGISAGGSFDITPINSIGAELEVIPPSTPNFPYPHLIGVTLYDSYHNGGIRAWVNKAANVDVEGKVAAVASDSALDFYLYLKQRLLQVPCLSLDAYERKNNKTRHYAIYPQGYDAKVCNFQ